MSEPNDRPAPEPHHDEGVDELLHRAESELAPDELRDAVHRSHEAGGHAAFRQGSRGLLWLALGGIFVASLVADWRFAFLAVLLLLFYALPYLTAAAADSGEEAERESLETSLEDHERREGPGPG